jgi:hypothetical protein
MRESRLSGSVEGVMSDHDSYSDFSQLPAARSLAAALLALGLIQCREMRRTLPQAESGCNAPEVNLKRTTDELLNFGRRCIYMPAGAEAEMNFQNLITRKNGSKKCYGTLHTVLTGDLAGPIRGIFRSRSARSA